MIHTEAAVGSSWSSMPVTETPKPVGGWGMPVTETPKPVGGWGAPLKTETPGPSTQTG